MIFKLARLSLWHRRSTVLLTLLSLSFSIALVLGVDHLRNQAKISFNKTLSGTDLIVGARSGSINLLLYAVFRIGNATNNISWQSYQELAKHSAVDWVIPLSLGDSHKGYRVLGTTQDYFTHYQYGQQQALSLAEGKAFSALYEVVLGAEVAAKLGYTIGDTIILAHGSGETNLSKHDKQPFVVSGILAPTGTPVDRTLHTSLGSIEAIHLGWRAGVPNESAPQAAQQADLTPSSITAMLVGLKSRTAIFNVQRQINEFPQEPLLAIVPGVALTELWQMLAMVEHLLMVIAVSILLAALLGMVTTLLAAMNERQREIAILRSLGAKASFIFILVELEIMLILGGAFVLAGGALCLSLAAGQPYLAQYFGLFISSNPLQSYTPMAASLVVLLALLLGAAPASAAYRRALSDGLRQRY
ncbi:MAG TPA: ABC transporter permease [Cellvibrionaceae bacterium]|nr:ABC transporter permease [Cellvibrionaceae bacterium]